MLNIINKISNGILPNEVIDIIYIYLNDMAFEYVIEERLENETSLYRKEMLYDRLKLREMSDGMYYRLLKKNPERIHKLNDRRQNNMDMLCKLNCVETIKIMNEKIKDISYWGLIRAIENDCFEVLEYLWNNFSTHQKLYNIISSYKIDSITSLEMIKWFYNKSGKYGIDFRYTEFLIDNNAHYGNIEIIEWMYNKCKKTGMQFLYTSKSIDYAKNIETVKWFWDKYKTDNLEFKYTYIYVDNSCKNNEYEKIKWLYSNNQLKFKYTNWAIFWAKKNNKMEFLEYIKNLK